MPPELASLGASARATTQPPVDRLKTTLDAIEMGFPPVSESSSASSSICGRVSFRVWWRQDKVKRVQAQQQAATGAAYDDVQQLSEALLSLPD